MLKKMQETINTLVTQVYKRNVDSNFMDQKVEYMKIVIRDEVIKEVIKEVDVIKDEVKVLSDHVSGVTTMITELRNNISDLNEKVLMERLRASSRRTTS